MLEAVFSLEICLIFCKNRTNCSTMFYAARVKANALKNNALAQITCGSGGAGDSRYTIDLQRFKDHETISVVKILYGADIDESLIAEYLLCVG